MPVVRRRVTTSLRSDLRLYCLAPHTRIDIDQFMYDFKNGKLQEAQKLLSEQPASFFRALESTQYRPVWATLAEALIACRHVAPAHRLLLLILQEKPDSMHHQLSVLETSSAADGPALWDKFTRWRSTTTIQPTPNEEVRAHLMEGRFALKSQQEFLVWYERYDDLYQMHSAVLKELPPYDSRYAMEAINGLMKVGNHTYALELCRRLNLKRKSTTETMYRWIQCNEALGNQQDALALSLSMVRKHRKDKNKPFVGDIFNVFFRLASDSKLTAEFSWPYRLSIWLNRRFL